MAPMLADFAGRWRIERRIDDRRGQDARFAGVAEFAPADDDTLRYHETGEIRIGAGPPIRAERRYRWTAAPGGRIAVSFPDGRPFHTFDPDEGVSSHFCAPDIYEVRYDFTAWPQWLAVWRVTGPRKDYTMTSLYMPVPGASR
jgi:hypothetical protein